MFLDVVQSPLTASCVQLGVSECECRISVCSRPRATSLILEAVWMGKQALAVTGTVAAEMVVVKGGPMISLEASLRQWRQEGRIADAKATAAQVEQLKKELAEAENLLAMQKSDLGDLLSESGGHRDMAAFEGAGDEGQETDDSESQDSSRRRTA